MRTLREKLKSIDPNLDPEEISINFEEEYLKLRYSGYHIFVCIYTHGEFTIYYDNFLDLQCIILQNTEDNEENRLYDIIKAVNENKDKLVELCKKYIEC